MSGAPEVLVGERPAVHGVDEVLRSARYSSNTASLVVRVLRRIKDLPGLLHCSPLWQKPYVRQAVSDKLFPLKSTIIYNLQLPDGVRTNRVVAEVPRFPRINFHGKIWANCGNMHWKQHVAMCRGFVALLRKPR